MYNLYWWLQRRRKVAGVFTVRLGNSAPNFDAINAYIEENLTYTIYSPSLGSYPPIRLMYCYDVIKQNITNVDGINSFIGYFQQDDTWKLLKTKEDGKEVYYLKIIIYCSPIYNRIVNSYQKYCAYPFFKARETYKKDLISFKEMLNQSAAIAGKYIDMNKHNFY